MFDDLKQNNQNPSDVSQSAPMAPAPQSGPPPRGPMEDMFADVDPSADKPSAVQSGKIKPISQTRLASAPGPALAEQMPARAMEQPEMLGADLAVTDARGGGFKKIALIVIGVFLAFGLALGAYVFIFNKPPNADTNRSNTNTTTNSNTLVNDSNSIVNTNPSELPPIDPALADDDGDGLTNEEERKLGTNALLPDTDNDRLFDKDEVEIYRSNPLLNDTDNDGLWDYDEIKVWFSNPLLADTDGDGYSDGLEVQSDYNPLGAGTIDKWTPPAPQPIPNN